MSRTGASKKSENTSSLQNKNGKTLRGQIKMKRVSRHVRLRVAEQDGRAGCILCGGVVKRNIHVGWMGSIVKSNHELFFRGWAEKDVGHVIGRKMPELTAAKCCMLASQAKELLDAGKDFLLLWSASLGGERAFFIFVPAAGKIAAIVRIVSAGHGDFITVIELGNAAKGKR